MLAKKPLVAGFTVIASVSFSPMVTLALHPALYALYMMLIVYAQVRANPAKHFMFIMPALERWVAFQTQNSDSVVFTVYVILVKDSVAVIAMEPDLAVLTDASTAKPFVLLNRTPHVDVASRFRAKHLQVAMIAINQRQFRQIWVALVAKHPYFPVLFAFAFA